MWYWCRQEQTPLEHRYRRICEEVAKLMCSTDGIKNYVEKINQFQYIAVEQLVIYAKIHRPMPHPHTMGKRNSNELIT